MKHIKRDIKRHILNNDAEDVPLSALGLLQSLDILHHFLEHKMDDTEYCVVFIFLFTIFFV